MKCKINYFLDLLKDATLDAQENEPSNEFKHGVNQTIEVAKCWFKDNNVENLEMNVKLY